MTYTHNGRKKYIAVVCRSSSIVYAMMDPFLTSWFEIYSELRDVLDLDSMPHINDVIMFNIMRNHKKYVNFKE